MTLTQWVDAENITVYHTPPREKSDRDALESLGVSVVDVENVSDTFSLNILSSGKPYGEMWHLTHSDADTVVWLDNDTIITRNIWDVIEGDFDFKARPEEDKSGDLEWQEMFEKHDMPLMDWRFNAGFLIFKNGLHSEIADRWIELMNSDLGYYGADLMKDAHSLALSVSDRNIEKMTQREHVMEWWGRDPIPSGYVYHYMTEQDPISELLGMIHRSIPEPVKRRLRRWRETR